MLIEAEQLSNLNHKLQVISKKLDKDVKAVGDTGTRILAEGANNIRNTIIKSMQTTQTDFTNFKKLKSGKFHYRSMEGFPPAIDTGNLITHIMFDIRNLEIEIGANAGTKTKSGVSYAQYLEEGTSKMAARPWLAPAVERHRQEIIDAMNKKFGDDFLEMKID